MKLDLAMLQLLLLACVFGASAAQTSHTVPDDVIPAAISVFGQRLYSSMATNKTELVFSPLSIHSALSMTSLGARGRTEAEMMFTLALDGIPGGPHDAYHTLMTSLSSASDVDVYTGNGVFLNPKLQVETDFIHNVEASYNATAANLIMMAAQGPEAAVNGFVEAHTEGLVKDLLPMYSITPNTVMLLVNTVYFNGSWASEFPLYKTGKRSFRQLGGATSQVDMMRDDRSVMLRHDDGLHADILQLPMAGGRFSMYIALPREVADIADLESSIVGMNVLDSLFQGFTRSFTHVEIPKFKVETALDLKAMLQGMGMTAACDPSLADFSGITKQPGAYISAVQHKAVIEVQESGVTAAAATAVTVYIKNLVMQTPESFIADHPFLFFLRDDQTQTVLFQGKYSG